MSRENYNDGNRKPQRGGFRNRSDFASKRFNHKPGMQSMNIDLHQAVVEQIKTIAQSRGDSIFKVIRQAIYKYIKEELGDEALNNVESNAGEGPTFIDG